MKDVCERFSRKTLKVVSSKCHEKKHCLACNLANTFSLSLPVKYKQLPVVQLEESSDTLVNISSQFISLEERERMY